MARKARIEARMTRTRTLMRFCISGASVEAMRPQTLRPRAVDSRLCLLERGARELLISLGCLGVVALRQEVLDLRVVIGVQPLALVMTAGAGTAPGGEVEVLEELLEANLDQ